MSLFPDITPLVNEIKKFATEQQKTNALLEEILKELRGASSLPLPTK